MTFANATSMVVRELIIQGRQSAALLEALLRSALPPPPGEHQELAAQILRCCDRVLGSLRGGGGAKKRKMVHGSSSTSFLPIKSKRRVSCAEALRMVKSSAMEDGYIWKKYGQKGIHGHKYPRHYYRCPHRDRGCGATRRMQQSQDDPSVYVITYFGEHTCTDGAVDEKAPRAVGIDFDSCSSPLSSLVQHDGRCRNDEVGSGEISPSGEECLGVQMGKVAGVEEPTPCDAFLGGFLDWESTIESFDFRDWIEFDQIVL